MYFFPYLEPSVVLCPVLTVAFWPSYRFLRRHVRWSGIPISLRIFQFVVIHTVKGFSIINEAEVDVFLELSCFLYDPVDASNLISGSSAFSKSSLNMWKFSVHVLLKPGLEYFEYYFACVWDECNCVVVWIFFGIAFLWDWNENWPFPVTIREIEIKTISYHLLRWLLKGLKYQFLEWMWGKGNYSLLLGL